MGYLYNFLKPGHSYFAAWRDYRRLKNLVWIAAGGFLLALVVAFVSRFVVTSEAPAFLVALASMLVAFVAHVRYMMWPCPRCHRRFFRSWYWSPLADKCLHCGLEKYAPCDPADQQWEFETQASEDR